MKESILSFLSCCLLIGLFFGMGVMLLGCTIKTPTTAIAQTITDNAQNAKKIISDTVSLEQCKNASVAEIDAIVRQSNDAIVACRTEIALERKDVKFWFWAFVVAVGIILAHIVKQIKGVFGI